MGRYIFTRLITSVSHQGHPTSGSHRGWVLVTVWVWSQGAVAVLTLGHQCFFGNPELSLELWAVIAGISGFDD